MRQEVEKVLRVLMPDGAMASQACKIVNEFNNRILFSLSSRIWCIARLE